MIVANGRMNSNKPVVSPDWLRRCLKAGYYYDTNAYDWDRIIAPIVKHPAPKPVAAVGPLPAPSAAASAPRTAPAPSTATSPPAPMKYSTTKLPYAAPKATSTQFQSHGTSNPQSAVVIDLLGDDEPLPQPETVHQPLQAHATTTAPLPAQPKQAVHLAAPSPAPVMKTDASPLVAAHTPQKTAIHSASSHLDSQRTTTPSQSQERSSAVPSSPSGPPRSPVALKSPLSAMEAMMFNWNPATGRANPPQSPVSISQPAIAPSPQAAPPKATATTLPTPSLPSQTRASPAPSAVNPPPQPKIVAASPATSATPATTTSSIALPASESPSISSVPSISVPAHRPYAPSDSQSKAIRMKLLDDDDEEEDEEEEDYSFDSDKIPTPGKKESSNGTKTLDKSDYSTEFEEENSFHSVGSEDSLDLSDAPRKSSSQRSSSGAKTAVDESEEEFEDEIEDEEDQDFSPAHTEDEEDDTVDVEGDETPHRARRAVHRSTTTSSGSSTPKTPPVLPTESMPSSALKVTASVKSPQEALKKVEPSLQQPTAIPAGTPANDETLQFIFKRTSSGTIVKQSARTSASGAPLDTSVTSTTSDTPVTPPQAPSSPKALHHIPVKSNAMEADPISAPPTPLRPTSVPPSLPGFGDSVYDSQLELPPQRPSVSRTTQKELEKAKGSEPAPVKKRKRNPSKRSAAKKTARLGDDEDDFVDSQEESGEDEPYEASSSSDEGQRQVWLPKKRVKKTAPSTSKAKSPTSLATAALPRSTSKVTKSLPSQRQPSKPSTNGAGHRKIVIYICGIMSDEFEHENQELENLKLDNVEPLVKSVLNATHVVVSDTAERTESILRAITTGKWVLRYKWYANLLRTGHLEPEEDYEMAAMWPGTRAARLEIAARRSLSLFEGRVFNTSPLPRNLERLVTDLVEAAGGRTSSRADAITVCPDDSYRQNRHTEDAVPVRYITDCIAYWESMSIEEWEERNHNFEFR